MRAQQGAGTPTAADNLAAAVERGARVLVASQENMAGGTTPMEWPYEGVYREAGQIPFGYRVGGTAICAWSLIETPTYGAAADVRAAVARALDFVLASLDEESMGHGFGGGYDVRGWGHTYALTFLLRLRALEFVPTDADDSVARAIAQLVQLIEDAEIPEVGGWAYSRRGGFGKPGPASPFMTAPTLLALFEAERQGEEVDHAVVERGLKALIDCRTEEGNVAYATGGGRAEAPGAIGRTPVTEMTLFLAGESDIERIRTSLDRFLEHWDWLEKRRRQTGTHVAPYGIAPYYFFYAHYYAAVAIEFLAEEDRPSYRARFLERLFQVQEESGGWNDRVFPRSENFGTAMSLLAILQPMLERPSAWRLPAPAAAAGRTER